MPAVIALDFDPVVRLGDLEVRSQTLLLALVLLGGLVLLARIGRRTPQPGPYVPPPPLGLVDIPFLALGIVPGAVVGGRLEAVLVHLDYYVAHPGAIVDPGQGSLGLGLAVVGGLAGGRLIAGLVGAPAGRWMHAAALPLLFVLAGGKIASVLAAEGQGRPTDAWWATAYVGPGPWASLAPELPSHPSQLYEAGIAIVALVIVWQLLRLGAFAERDGSALLAAIGLWAAGRFAVAFTWRDAPVLGPLVALQLVCLGIGLVAVLGVVRLRSRRSGAEPVRGRTGA